MLHHSASGVDVLTWEDIHRIHVEERGFDSIGYHWGVVEDGNGFCVKPGRPVHIAGAHARGRNAESIGICFEGNRRFERRRTCDGF